ncbi:sensor histidine kinase [Amycolatopsis sacchari]|uniref:sensor histidine kinase n=1 Tax=Amycolatopsis sacchari TaxID=115433 RepID=UPI003D717A30
MATRARELLNRSRALLERSREAAAQFLNTPHPPPSHPPRALEAAPAPEPPVRPDPGASSETLAAICANVALRDLNLVDSLLSQLEEMEAKEEDTDRLAELYSLDHLATRLRRNAENLRVLAGRDASDSTSDTSSLVDVVRAGMSSIDHYSRVTIGRVVSLGVVGFAAEDLSRLLAELLDNATKSSPPNAPVRVSAHLTEQGSVLLRIEDEGIGLPPERLRELNDRLSAAPVLDDSAVRHMGLAVVRRLAARHELRVWLDRRVPHGTTASVLLPAALVSELPEASWSGAQTVIFPSAGSDGASSFAPGAPARAATSVLPQRSSAPEVPAPPSPRPRPPVEPTVGGTTASGLPRRVSHSIKAPNGHEAKPPAPSADPGADRQAGHDKLLADLGAFSDGERAAREERRDSDGTGETDAGEGKQQ